MKDYKNIIAVLGILFCIEALLFGGTNFKNGWLLLSMIVTAVAAVYFMFKDSEPIT